MNPRTFNDLINLEKILFSNNLIQKIDPNIFDCLTKLKRIESDAWININGFKDLTIKPRQKKNKACCLL